MLEEVEVRGVNEVEHEVSEEEETEVVVLPIITEVEVVVLIKTLLMVVLDVSEQLQLDILQIEVMGLIGRPEEIVVIYVTVTVYIHLQAIIVYLLLYSNSDLYSNLIYHALLI